MSRLLTSFMSKLFGRSALNGQKDQEVESMDKSHMTEMEFEQMEKRLRPRIMQMGREFFGSDTEAEEVVQETWLRAWNVRERVVLTDAYVLRIARNCCVSMWRGQRTVVELADEENAVTTEITPQEEMEERENSEWLQSRIKRLPKAEREVWQLFYDEGQTVEEIAQARGITVGTVRKTISNVRSTLRKDIRHRFFNLRHLIMFTVIALVTGLTFAAIFSPGGVVRGAVEHIFGIPEDTTIYNVVEVMPSYPGDMVESAEFLMNNLHYPEEAEAKGIEGRVIVRFVVEKDGRLTNFEVMDSPDPLLSEEALRILKKMPAWIPAKNKGKDVRCRYSMPVMFRLK